MQRFATNDLNTKTFAPEDMTWSSAIILRKTVVSHWLKSPLCSSWKFIAAYSNFKMANCCRCRGLTRAIYILSIEHLRMLCLSRESNPGPPALQASTLWKEPFERPYLVAIRDLARFYIFCTLTGDNDQYPSLNIWLQPEYFTAENFITYLAQTCPSLNEYFTQTIELNSSATEQEISVG